MDLRVALTADLDPARLRAARALLDAAFGGFADEDWEHCLGGVHALALVDGELVLRTGFVEGVGVRADQRRRGHAGAMMAALERIVRGGHDLGALSASDAGAAVYTARGWLPWTGPTFALTPDGVRRTPDDDGTVHVLPVTVALDRTAALTCDWRDGDVW